MRTMVRSTRGYLAGFGTSGSLLAGAAALFVLVSAIVAFRGWPQIATGPATTVVAAAAAPTTPSQTARRLAVVLSRHTAAGTVGVTPNAAGTGRTHTRAASVRRGSGASSAPPRRTPGTGAGPATGTGGSLSTTGAASCGGSCGQGVLQNPITHLTDTVSKAVSTIGSDVGSVGSGVGSQLGSGAGNVGGTVGALSPQAGNAVQSAGTTAGNAVSGTATTAGNTPTQPGNALTGGH